MSSVVSSANYAFTKKLRAAIKAKIEEMGVDADDELPDYVMVLAANRKEKPQMKSDLQLFLGKFTSPFVDWLFQAFDRIQKSGTETTEQKPDPSPSPPKKEEKRKEDESSKHSKKSKKKPKIEAPTNADLKRPTNLNSRCGPLQNAVVSILKTNPPIKKPRESEKKRSKDDRHSSKRKTETERVEVKRESRRRIEYEDDHRKSPEARKRRVDEREEKVVVIKERKREHRSKHERQVDSPLEVGDSPPRFRAVKQHDRKDTKRASPIPSSSSVLRTRSPSVEIKRAEKRKRDRTPEIIELSPDPPPKAVEEKEDTNSTTFIIRLGNKEIRRTVANDPPDPHGANDKNNTEIVEKKRKRRADDPGRTAARLLGNQLKATIGERPRITAPVGSTEPVVKKPKMVEQSSVKQQVTSGVGAEMKTESSLKPLTASWNGRITIEDESSDEDEQQIDKVIAALDREQLTSQILPTAMLTRPTYYPAAIQQQLVSQSSSVSYVALPTIQQPQRSNERCRFWPNCDRAEACVFHHPTKPCATFPNCSFGDKCLYIHPICKFNTRCTRPNCPFTHDLKGTATQLLQAIQPAVQSKTTIPCRYQGKCTDPNCAFFHPPDCRYGMSCTNPRCTFSHKRPDLKKFQWTATSTSS
ncbi:Zinc finger CCCH domain-containing protein 14 [Aphelenchoides besseyi]|nr:Zinc finger CCCH domain-containing protein 14 [Aphelenchoides besseyi]